jgi:hypothetical protein
MMRMKQSSAKRALYASSVVISSELDREYAGVYQYCLYIALLGIKAVCQPQKTLGSLLPYSRLGNKAAGLYPVTQDIVGSATYLFGRLARKYNEHTHYNKW